MHRLPPVGEANDNNAIMAQLLLQGTNFVNFVGMHAWVGLEGGFEAVRVTEWDEPQAVIGSYLQRFAYPDFYRLHVERNGRELINWTRGETFDRNLSGETRAREQFDNIVQGTRGRVGCLQNRGEYMFVAEGRGGFRVYDIASIANKGFSERIVTAPFSPLGHDTHVALAQRDLHGAADQPADRARPQRGDGGDAAAAARTARTISLLEENQEQRFHPIYNYAVVTDAEEGLFLVNVNTLADGDPRNNRLRRAVTWNEGGVLAGARHITLAGHYAYIAAAAGLVVVDLDDPLHPRHVVTMPLTDARASALQFRYLWVTDAEGLKLFDVTELAKPVPVPSATVPLRRTPGASISPAPTPMSPPRQQGLAIVDITNPERPRRAGIRHLRRADERRRGRGRRLDQRLALRLCRRRAERDEGAPADLARRASPISTASRRGRCPS